MIYQKILNEHKRLTKLIQKLQSQINALPDGKLIYTRNGIYSKWYINDGSITRHLSKKERPLAEKLSLKKFLSLQLKNAIHEQKALEFYLRHHDNQAEQKELDFVNSPEFDELLSSHYQSLSQELYEWQHCQYIKNEQNPEHLIHKAYSGNLVRSKSEVLIDTYLFKNNIPFRYECFLQLGTQHLYPDFTIRHPKTGELYYWEHFGLMDDPSYIQNACAKIKLYTLNGIIPSVNLIMTFETKQTPLTTDVIEKIIEHYFL